jgi:FMN-dependent NADH-azoreductase
MKLLHIDSSILGDGSVSRQLSAAIVESWRKRVPDIEVMGLDLATEPLHHLSGALFVARTLPIEQRNPEQQKDIEASDKALDDFLAADIVVIGAPMYNFGIPSQLKAWIDRIAIAGKTFSYTAEGPKGLAGGKTVIVASSRGGIYSAGTPLEIIDFQERYLSAVFNFFGITDIEFIRAEGVNFSPDHKARAIETALDAIADPAIAA